MTAVAAIDADMRRMTRASAACRRLMTIPGVGQLTALAFVAAIDDPSRIRRSRDVGAYLGLVQRRYQSGEVDYVGGISKCGDRRVRTLLYEAANVMLTRYKGQLKLKDWAFAIARRSTMRKARIALARRLAIIIHAMLRDRSTYGRLRFQPSRPAPSLPHQAPNERAENTGIPRRRDPEEASPLTRSAAASKSPVRVKGRTLERHRLSRWPVERQDVFAPVAASSRTLSTTQKVSDPPQGRRTAGSGTTLALQKPREESDE
jgi:hypothetical protein